jgi:hypothetical protein
MPKLQKKLTQTEFYCVSCRKRVKPSADSIYFGTDKRGHPRLTADCKNGCQLFKYVKESAVPVLKKKYA